MELGPITDSFRYSNYVEGVVWIVVGLLAFKAARDRHRPRHALPLLVVFILFGFSDCVESTTGAWWRPWWLFVWKATGVIAILAITLHARYAGNRSSSPQRGEGL